MIRFVLILLILVAAGCRSYYGQADSPFFSIPAGSRLTLLRPIEFSADSLRASIQGGQVGYGANQYYPFCKLELWDFTGSRQRVEPDQFQVVRVTREVDQVVSIDPRRSFAAIAGVGIGIGVGFSAVDINGSPSPQFYNTYLYLQSVRQPNVYRLICGHLQDPNMTALYLSIDQIRQALQGVFTLELPGGQPPNPPPAGSRP